LPDGLEQGYPAEFPIPGRFGIARAIDDQRVGNTERLSGFAPGTPVSAFPRKQILNVSLQQIAAALKAPDKQFDTGSWELVVAARVSQPWNAAGFFCVCPLVATVEMGVGGATTTVELQAFPSATIPLPCDKVIVNIGWDTFRPEDYVTEPGFVPLAVPGEVEVTATIQRSVGSSDARRTFVFRPGFAAGTTASGLVPAHAKRVMAYSVDSAQVYAAGALFQLQASDLAEITAGFATGISTYTGPQMFAIRNAGEMIDVPGNARRWIYIGDGAVPIGNPVFVDFEIGL